MARYIDADRLIKELDHRYNKAYGNYRVLSHEEYITAIEDEETADVEPVRHGRWIIDEADGCEGMYAAYIEYHCSECGYEDSKETGQHDWVYGEMPPENYCPNCGAKMNVDGIVRAHQTEQLKRQYPGLDLFISLGKFCEKAQNLPMNDGETVGEYTARIMCEMEEHND